MVRKRQEHAARRRNEAKEWKGFRVGELSAEKKKRRVGHCDDITARGRIICWPYEGLALGDSLLTGCALRCISCHAGNLVDYYID